jgi:solute carrier family 25 carnitine/acylcarnitine transporter 20/29
MANNLLANGFAGICGAFLASPTELIKCRLQHQGAHSTALTAHAAWVRLGCQGLEPTTYRGPMDVVRSIWVKERGLLGLSTGLRATLVRDIPGIVAMFSVYEGIKSQMVATQVRTCLCTAK